MAITVSGLYIRTFVDALDPTNLAVDLTATANRAALLSNGATPNFNTDTTFSATYEVAGTGWAAGGVQLSVAGVGGTSVAPTLVASGGQMVYAMGDIAVAGTTLIDARALQLKTSGDYLLLLVDFGADYDTNNGTFGVQWDVVGVFALGMVGT